MATLDGLSIILDFLKPLQPKVQAQIARKIFTLSVEPFPNDSEMLQGYKDLRRIDCGEFRVVYRYEEQRDSVVIVLVGKRNDDEAYKRLKRMMG